MGNNQNRQDLFVQDLFTKVTMYLDNELTKDAEKELLHEVQTNPTCYQLLCQEKSFRHFIKSHIQRRPVSPALLKSIRERIKGAVPRQ